MLGRYVDAWHASDVPALLSLLREDALLTMPPFPAAYRGGQAIGQFLRSVPAGGRLDHADGKLTEALRQLRSGELSQEYAPTDEELAWARRELQETPPTTARPRRNANRHHHSHPPGTPADRRHAREAGSLLTRRRRRHTTTRMRRRRSPPDRPRAVGHLPAEPLRGMAAAGNFASMGIDPGQLFEAQLSMLTAWRQGRVSGRRPGR
ncbi:MAG: hypothetical protein ACRDRJ_11835 [Streptosporangiaceae bacterium]